MKKVLFVKVHKALKEGREIEEATRRWWKITDELGKSIDYIAGMNHSELVSVYKVENGVLHLDTGRYEFKVNKKVEKDMIKNIEKAIIEFPKPMSWVLKSIEI